MSDNNIGLQKIIVKKGNLEYVQLYEEIINRKIKLCVGKINYGVTSASCGFFYLEKMDIKLIITNKHFINQETLNSYNKINIFVNGIKKEIDLTKKRFIYSGKDLDYIVIQILESDFIDNYLEIDDDIFTYDYKDEFIYCLQFPEGEELKKDSGNIIKLENGLIEHSISTFKGSSGSPLLLANHKIVGIHRGTYINKNKNEGIFMKDIILELIQSNVNPARESPTNILFYRLIKFIMKFKYYLCFISFGIILNLLLIFMLIYYFGKKKLYYENGNLKYYGFMKDGKKHGYGISFYENTNIEYEGYWEYDYYEGKGKKYNNIGKLIYDGSWKNGK